MLFVAAMSMSPLVAACSTGDPAPLPDSDRRVSSDAPLTADQATSVRSSGRKLMRDFLDRLPTAGTGVDTDNSTEQWGGCTAQQKSFAFHPTQNGVNYSARVYVDTTQPLTVDEVHAQLKDLSTTWEDGDGSRGTNGVFTVRVNPREQPAILAVSSPCYFLRDADGLSPQEIKQVTGFNSRKWEE